MHKKISVDVSFVVEQILTSIAPNVVEFKLLIEKLYTTMKDTLVVAGIRNRRIAMKKANKFIKWNKAAQKGEECHQALELTVKQMKGHIEQFVQ